MFRAEREPLVLREILFMEDGCVYDDISKHKTALTTEEREGMIQRIRESGLFCESETLFGELSFTSYMTADALAII